MIPGNLTESIILFGGILRKLGLDTYPNNALTAIQGLTYIQLSNKIDFYHTLRSTLIFNVEDYPLFDQAFNAFWISLSKKVGDDYQPQTFVKDIFPEFQNNTNSQSIGEKSQGKDSKATLFNQITNPGNSYSYQEVLRRKDFSEISPDESKDIEVMISQINWIAPKQRSRRWGKSNSGDPSWRGTIRKNMRNGGEILQWSFRSPKLKSRPIVIIADISGSMEAYSSFFIHFMHNISNKIDQRVESFVFSTRLTRISRQLRAKDINNALNAASKIVEDWSGGTRIGESLKIFNRDWASRVLRRSAVIIIISDGWDRGDSQLLKKEIALLRRNCSHLIWLNPLLGSPDYQPLTRGMQTSMPYIDDFLPAHNLASLENFSSKLSRLSQNLKTNQSLHYGH